MLMTQLGVMTPSGPKGGDAAQPANNSGLCCDGPAYEPASSRLDFKAKLRSPDLAWLDTGGNGRNPRRLVRRDKCRPDRP